MLPYLTHTKFNRERNHIMFTQSFIIAKSVIAANAAVAAICVMGCGNANAMEMMLG